MMRKSQPKLYGARAACKLLGVSHPTLQKWIREKKIRTVKTQGGRYLVAKDEIDRLVQVAPPIRMLESRRQDLRSIRGRNQLVGRIVDVKIEGLLAQVTLSVEDQDLISIITADAARDMRLEKGQIAAALIKSSEVMIMS